MSTSTPWTPSRKLPRPHVKRHHIKNPSGGIGSSNTHTPFFKRLRHTNFLRTPTRTTWSTPLPSKIGLDFTLVIVSCDVWPETTLCQGSLCTRSAAEMRDRGTPTEVLYHQGDGRRHPTETYTVPPSPVPPVVWVWLPNPTLPWGHRLRVQPLRKEKVWSDRDRFYKEGEGSRYDPGVRPPWLPTDFGLTIPLDAHVG